MSQCDKIVDYMKEHDGITQRDAIIAFGCYRLAARIFDLREKGYIIESEREHTDGYFDNHVRYRLVKDPFETKVSISELLRSAFSKWKKDISN